MTGPLELEPIAARGWPARRTARLGGWRLHASEGASGRINSCWPLAAPDRAAETAIDAAEAWYAGLGLPPAFKLADGGFDPRDLAQRLTARGYAPRTPTLTMTGPLDGEPDPAVVIEPDAGAGYTAVFADPAFGAGVDAAERLGALARMPRPRGFALLRLDGVPAAVGACVVEGDWAGVIGMRTAPAQRRKGLARRVLRALAAFARQEGARRGYLQVEAGNAAAIALYRAEGFEDAYVYRYWKRQ
jgi:ribosomal protein S18 acetylase RimI-like enzyme